MIEAFDVVQHERCAIPVGQLLYRAFDIETSDGCVAYRCRFVPSTFAETNGDGAHARLPAAHEIEAMMKRQPVEPGSDGGLTSKAVELAIRLKKDLLQEILALLARSRHSAGQAVDARRMHSIQFFKGIAISSPAARD